MKCETDRQSGLSLLLTENNPFDHDRTGGRGYFSLAKDCSTVGVSPDSMAARRSA